MQKTQSKNKKIIAIIPARGGSKGIPRKNIKIFAGKPLIAYTIEVALKSRYLDRIIVSTEDKEIAEISKKYGAEVIKRPQRLANDFVAKEPVLEHALEHLRRHENYKPDLLVCLQSTSPLRTTADLDKAIRLFLENKVNSVVSVCQVEHSFCWYCRIDKYLKPIFGRRFLRQRRQESGKVYMPNGAIYISRPETLFKQESFFGSKILPYIMPPERSVDIDTDFDFKVAERIMKNEEN